MAKRQPSGHGSGADGSATGRERSAIGQGPWRTVRENRSLAVLVLAFSAVTVAEWAYVTALAVDALRRGGTLAVSFVGLRLFIGAASSLATVGYPPRRQAARTLPGLALGRALGLGASAGFASTERSLLPLFVVLGLDAVASAQYRPAMSRLVTLYARSPRELVGFATATSTLKTLSQALGGVAGGLLLVVATPTAVFAGAGGVFLLAGYLTSRLPPEPEALALPQNPAGEGRPALRRVMAEAAQAVRGSRVTGIVVVGGLRTFVRGMWMAIAVIASVRLLHAGSAGVGLLMLAAGLGALVAAPLSSALISRPRLGTPVVLALVACGVPLALIAGAPALGLALVLVGAWAVGMAVADVATASLMYRLVESPLVPRVTGVIESTKLALEGLGGFIAPLLVAAFGTRVTLLVAAAPLPAVAAARWRMLHRVDASAGERAERLELVHGVQWLQGLEMASLDNLVSRLARRRAAPGEDVTTQGANGDEFFIIEAGQAEVWLNGFLVGVLGRGDSFGERALLRNVPRMATVRAATPLELLVLSRDDFLAATTSGFGAVRAESPEARGLSNEKDWPLRDRADILSKLALLGHLEWPAIVGLAARSQLQRWPAGAQIVREGERGDRFFVLLSGRAEVGSGARRLGELRPGDPFGEIAPLYDVPRTADVVATTPALTLSLHRDDFVPAVRARLLSG